MAHKTITISEKAYNSLAEMKKEGESFTEVVLRITGKTRRKENFMQWLENNEPLNDLADAIEGIIKERQDWRLRSADL